MKLIGMGTDILEIYRIAEAIDEFGERFLAKHFTENEILYCKRYRESSRHFAGRFAAKEAIAKALGTGFGEKLSWLDIEVLNDASGKPCVTLLRESLNDVELHVSISHCKTVATASAIALGA